MQRRNVETKTQDVRKRPYQKPKVLAFELSPTEAVLSNCKAADSMSCIVDCYYKAS